MDLATEIKTRTRLSEVFMDLFPETNLNKGNEHNRMGHCPGVIHGRRDRNKSLSVSDNKGLWHCFGCGNSGTVIDACMFRYGCDAAEAIQALAKKYLIHTPKTFTPKKSPAAPVPDIPQTDEKTLQAQQKATAIYEDSLVIADNEKGGAVDAFLEYLRNRSIHPPSIKAIARNIRFKPRHFHSRDDATGEWRIAGAVIAGIYQISSNEQFIIKGIQQIFIDKGFKVKYPDNESPGEYLPAKKSKGTIGGGCCPLWRGIDDNGECLPALGKHPCEEVFICEGLENGLVLAEAYPHKRVFISNGLETLAKLKFPRKWQIVSATVWTDPPKATLSPEALKRYWQVIHKCGENLRSQNIRAYKAQVQGGDLNDVWEGCDERNQ